jgi:hypothetical protein
MDILENAEVKLSVSLSYEEKLVRKFTESSRQYAKSSTEKILTLLRTCPGKFHQLKFAPVTSCDVEVSVTFLNYSKLHTSVSIMVTVVKQWVQLRYPLLHKYGFNCHIRKVWLPWLPSVTCHSLT